MTQKQTVAFVPLYTTLFTPNSPSVTNCHGGAANYRNTSVGNQFHNNCALSILDSPNCHADEDAIFIALHDADTHNALRPFGN